MNSAGSVGREIVRRFIDDQGIQRVRRAHQLDTFDGVDSRLPRVRRVLGVLGVLGVRRAEFKTQFKTGFVTAKYYSGRSPN
jgi:hypothetical protein